MSTAIDNEAIMTDDLEPRGKRRKHRRYEGGVLTYAVAILVASASVAPVVYAVLGGFRTSAQINESPAGFPNPWNLEGYADVLSESAFWGQVMNSTIVALGTAIGVIMLATMAAYPLARYTFPGRDTVFGFFTLGLMFPITVASLPLYLLIRDVGLQGSLWGLVIPQVAFQLPMAVVIMRPFVKAIPRELEEAAQIDGASRIGFFFRILLRLTMPAMITVGVLAFVFSWNAYLLPLLVLTNTDPGGLVLPLGVQRFAAQYTSDTARILAFTSVSMLPALVFFTAMERRIVGGLTGAVKG